MTKTKEELSAIARKAVETRKRNLATQGSLPLAPPQDFPEFAANDDSLKPAIDPAGIVARALAAAKSAIPEYTRLAHVPSGSLIEYYIEGTRYATFIAATLDKTTLETFPVYSGPNRTGKLIKAAQKFTVPTECIVGTVEQKEAEDVA